MKKKILFAVSLLALAVFATGCANSVAKAAAADTPAPVEAFAISTIKPNTTEIPVTVPTMAPTQAPTATPASTPSAANGTLELTLDQLKQYDGKNGNPAYIAVDGVIYDVSDVSRWKNGSHEGYSAGKDLTDAIMGKSPHGTSVLEGVPIVGKLIG